MRLPAHLPPPHRQRREARGEEEGGGGLGDGDGVVRPELHSSADRGVDDEAIGQFHLSFPLPSSDSRENMETVELPVSPGTNENRLTGTNSVISPPLPSGEAV